ncbi:MAG TPA: antitoxin Xre/MbcA/ParS toxin-binding domain-containing protein [Paraburkholderia sp.]|uniref:type II RES/Xre toxin-antitoxin system antitoxin n=1 Tax=Paraburkholderia sp. TaxID=1926495 RepID=UPI002B496115|nr:antitoxin Xre/MbcA/ParS toxin-binding domain-containing protein [Paraburkholderia sp.]HKR44536.1 antitoxin Xre/MbcA/ParS toxin-binding domain-containing protein [Paraburkholderia sp.]
MSQTGETNEPHSLFAGLLNALKLRIATHAEQRPTEPIDAAISKLADITPLQTHDIVINGLPVSVARDFMATYRIVSRKEVLQTIGVSERTLQRGKNFDLALDSNASDRLIRLAAVTEHAIDVFGSKDAAERWLVTPALGLDGRKPLDLLQTSEGVKLVKLFLTRIDYDVCS